MLYAIQYETMNDTSGNPRHAFEVYDSDGNLKYRYRYSYMSPMQAILSVVGDDAHVILLNSFVRITTGYYKLRFKDATYI